MGFFCLENEVILALFSVVYYPSFLVSRKGDFCPFFGLHIFLFCGLEKGVIFSPSTIAFFPVFSFGERGDFRPIFPVHIVLFFRLEKMVIFTRLFGCIFSYFFGLAKLDSEGR